MVVVKIFLPVSYKHLTVAFWTFLSDISGDKTTANNGSFDYWIVKTDSSGNVEWDKTIGGSVTDYLSSIIQTADGGYLLSGLSSSGIGGDKNEANLGIMIIGSLKSILWKYHVAKYHFGFESSVMFFKLQMEVI